MAETPREQGSNPLAAVPRERLAAELHAIADGLVTAQRASESVDAVSAVLDQLRGLELTESVLGAVGDADAANCTVLSGPLGAPLTEWLLIPFGAVEVEGAVAGRSFVFTREHADAAVAWFDRLGRKLAVDYEHQTFAQLNGRADGLRPAAGWIGQLAVRDDGLWAMDVTWTARARALLASGEYRYFSPVIFWEDERYETLVGLGPVALTNDPAMHAVTPLAASRWLRGERAEDVFDSDESDGAETRAALASEVALLRRELAFQEADRFVERGLRAGKILEANSLDWRADFLRDAAAAEARLARAPVVLPPGRLTSGRRELPGTTTLEQERRRGFGRDEIEAADLEAYEAACAAGRVRRFGNWS